MRDVFREHAASLAARRSLHPREARAAWCIANCYGPGCGSHTLACPRGHYTLEQPHACGHRSCPRCAERPRHAWIEAELTRLLPCAHFHVVFTLPHELLALWEFNRERLSATLFDSVRTSLLELLADARHLGATPGILMALHTWGRNLSHHPHVHALVSAGGLTPEQRWQPSRAGFLLPLEPLRRLFAGKLLGALRSLLERAELRLPPRQPGDHWAALVVRLYRQHWNIQINAPYASGRSVALYLARYAKGGPLPRQRALFMHTHCVAFDYTDHRDGRTRRLRLHAHEFISRILWHAPPKGLHTVRHAGLYASACKRQHLRAAIALGWAPPPPASDHAALLSPPSAPRLELPRVQLCPRCGQPLWRSASSHAPPARNQFTLVQSAQPRIDLGPASVHLGPTLRSSGHPPAAPPGAA